MKCTSSAVSCGCKHAYEDKLYVVGGCEDQSVEKYDSQLIHGMIQIDKKTQSRA